MFLCLMFIFHSLTFSYITIFFARIKYVSYGLILGTMRLLPCTVMGAFCSPAARRETPVPTVALLRYPAVNTLEIQPPRPTPLSRPRPQFHLKVKPLDT